MDKILERYRQLSEREQYLVLVSAVVVLIGGFYLLLWNPLNDALESGHKAVEAKRSELAWVKKNAQRVLQLKQSAGGKASFSGSLPQAVNQTAGRLRIVISRMQPQGDELKVWVDQAPFNDVLSWLQALENRGVKIINLDIAQADNPGQVKIRSLQLGKS